MNSTNKRALDNQLEDAFTNVVTPLAERLRRGGRCYFASGANPACVSYFEEPRRARMERGDFRLAAGDSAQALAAGLAEYWERTGDLDLLGLAPTLERLAIAIMAELAPDLVENVSESVYAMY